MLCFVVASMDITLHYIHNQKEQQKDGVFESTQQIEKSKAIAS
jgi:hypothetical protein